MYNAFTDWPDDREKFFILDLSNVQLFADKH